MSGVFPGSRSSQFQRVRLARLDSSQDESIWARIHWTDDPRACDVHLLVADDEARLLRLQVPEPDHFLADLRAALTAVGYGLQTCGSCLAWRPARQPSKDQLPVGFCAWREAKPPIPEQLMVLTVQSGLALDCMQWADAAEAQPPSDFDLAPTSLARAAVEKKEEERAAHSLWGRLKTRFSSNSNDEPAPDWGARLLEQSGVGAGTEPCFACQGRLANLGSRTGPTSEGDEETFSVWRCRSCHTLYLNHWIDRWVRLDTLETVECHYRLAPAEAVGLLTQMDRDTGDMHFMSTIKSVFTERKPLSRQVKQGR